MKWSKCISLVEAHAEGEVGRVATSGIPLISGTSMLEKMDHINEVDDSIRRFIVFEPRGHAPMSTNLILPPAREDADLGLIILQGDRAHAMSGSNCMCVVTAVLETGRLAMQEPVTEVRLDTPAGLVVATAYCKHGKCERVELDMTPGFVQQLDAQIDLAGSGRVNVDIAFGGVYYALVDPSQLGLEIDPSQARALVNAGCQIHRAVNRQLVFQHPKIPSLNRISYVMFTSNDGNGNLLGATILPPGRIDRSPCGTGNTARLAVRAARGEAEVGETLQAYSITGGKFSVAFTSHTEIAGRPAVNARISGRSWIYGIHQIGLDPSDPFPEGHLLSDCWGEAFDLLN